jgi:PAS domain S-box-containing protein
MATDFGALLADPLPDAAIVTAAEGTLLHWNKSAEATFGCSVAEALGRSLSDLIVVRLHLESRANSRRGIDDR